jgi:hypothetical protein
VASHNDLPYVLKQRFEIFGQRIASEMAMTHELIQIVPQAYKLAVDHPLHMVICSSYNTGRCRFIEEKHSTKMDSPHANGFGSLSDTRQLGLGQAEIKLFAAWFCFDRPSHVVLLAERMRPGFSGAISSGP